MLTNIKITTKNGSVFLDSMFHIEIDYGDESISISLDNGKVYVIPKNSIINEQHTDSIDLFECIDGITYLIEYPETKWNSDKLSTYIYS